MTIAAKFGSTCSVCHRRIAAGELIEWNRGVSAVRHATPAGCRVALEIAVPAAPVVDLTALVAFLTGARNRGLKSPRVRFAAPGSGELLLSLAPQAGRNPGAVYVKLNGEYIGKVAADGTASGLSDAIVKTLAAIGTDPARAAEFHGATTGRCSFCGLTLTDEGSTEVGYGPICADRYGLPHTAKGSAKTVPTVYAPTAESSDDYDGTLDYNEAVISKPSLFGTSPYRGRRISEA